MDVSTADIDKSNSCLSWLQTHNAQGLTNIYYKYSSDVGGSLGCYAARDLTVGDVIFTVPQKCLFGIGNTSCSDLSKAVRAAATELGNSKLATSELLIWLHMCQQRADPSSMFYPYFHSLDDLPPNLDNWPAELKDAFCGTSLAASLADKAPQNSLSSHLTLLEHTFANNKSLCDTFNKSNFDRSSLAWARGHYLSRRYPGKYASDQSIQSAEDLVTDGREYGMQNLGIMVPLLDILNHDSSQEWLRFEVKDEALQ
eukprot:gene34538-39046_t